LILESFEHDLEEVTLIPSQGGVFEVQLGEVVLFSKKKEGRNAEYEEVMQALRAELKR